MAKNDLFSNLRQKLNEQDIDFFHILEDLVPIKEQMYYFKYFDQLRKENSQFNPEEEIAILFSSEESVERKRRSLTLLASIPDIGAYRSIETYHSNPIDKELEKWSSMSLVSSRIILSSDLSGHQQIYISSGLGGQDKKLRFFSLFSTLNREPFTNLQKEIIEREFKFQIQRSEVIIEKFEIENNYFTILMLFPFDINVKSSLNDAIAECNQYGNFLDKKYLFTNVKILDKMEIDKLLNKQ